MYQILIDLLTPNLAVFRLYHGITKTLYSIVNNA